MGDSGLPVAHAGHCDWHRPHSVQVAMSSRPFQVKSSIFPSPNTSVSGSASSKSSTFPLLRIGSSGPSASGRRENRTFTGASAMCRCLEYTTITANAMITPICASRNTASSTLSAPAPSGCRTCATAQDANAHACGYGNTPVSSCAPRYASSVTMTRKIIPRTTHAARVCEPKNRDPRPSRRGLLRTRITVNVPIPASTPTANRSSIKPIAAQCPIPGIANLRSNRSP